MLYQKSKNQDDKMIISFTLPYECIVKPSHNIYHESLIHSDWRFKQPSTTANENLFDPSGSSLSSSNNVHNSNSFNDKSLIFDNLASLRSVVNQLNESYASYGIIVILNEFRLSNMKLSISIIGKHSYRSEMNSIKLQIFQKYSKILKSTITIDPRTNRHCFINNEIKVELINFINSVSQFNKTSIYIERSDTLASTFTISVVGYRDQVKVTENKINLFIDDMNPNFFSDYLELSSISILPLICGTNMSTLKRIIKQTNCNIYLPNLLPELFYNNSLEVESRNPKIFITGLRSQVLLAKKWLSDMIINYTNNPFIKQLPILPVKREILIISQLVEQNCDLFDEMMFKTSCYLSLPPLGYQSIDNNEVNQYNTNKGSSSNRNNNKSSLIGDLITVQGNSIEEVEILIDELTNKASSFYSEKVEFTVQSNSDHPIDINKLLNFNDSLTFNSNCFVTCSKVDNKYIFQLMGNSENIKIATNCLTQFETYSGSSFSNQFVQYQIELTNKEKDFIAGKKNGKIIKIINMSAVSIKLLPFNDQNFIVEISGNELMDAVVGLGLFEDELPTIFHFNVPESFHRQIIGVGGQTIQIIMRKFNVFVKFSNSFELSDKTLDSQHILQSTNFQQSFIRKNNVIIKCPSKNKSEIPLAKLELEKLVDKVKRNSYSSTTVRLSLQQWKLLTSAEFNILFNINRKKPTNFITELEKKTNTFISYPPLDSISNNQESVIIEIYGVENNSKLCFSELKKIIPYSYRFKINKSSNIDSLIEIIKLDKAHLLQMDSVSNLQISFLNNIVVPMKILYNVELEIKSEDQYDSFILYYYPHAFSFNFNISNAERLNDQTQSQIVMSQQFSQIVQSMVSFLNDWHFDLVDSGIYSAELFTIESNSPSNTKSNTNTSTNTNTNTNTNSSVNQSHFSALKTKSINTNSNNPNHNNSTDNSSKNNIW
ncbi:unnamed protein product [Pichia kudriavzevii]